MDYEIEVRVYKRPGELDKDGYPVEVDVYSGRKTYNPETDNLQSYMDGFKEVVAEFIEEDVEQERVLEMEFDHGDAYDRAEVKAKALQYHKKYGDLV